jgi:hypothetical protein
VRDCAIPGFGVVSLCDICNTSAILERVPEVEAAEVVTYICLLNVRIN